MNHPTIQLRRQDPAHVFRSPGLNLEIEFPILPSCAKATAAAYHAILEQLGETIHDYADWPMHRTKRQLQGISGHPPGVFPER